MKSGTQKSGFTLIEILAVIAIILILISVMAGVGKRIDDQGKERLCRTTIELVGNALEQFRDFDYEYRGVYSAGLDFPVDCTGFDELSFTNALQYALDLNDPPAIVPSADPCQTENSGSEALYFFLNQVPDCRTTLEKIDKSLLTNKDKNGVELRIKIGTIEYPLLRFIDPWGTTLRYDYYDELLTDPALRDQSKKTFPVITSAGPDKVFDTKDDVSNRELK